MRVKGQLFPQLVEQSRYGKVDDMGANRANFDLVDVEQRIQHARHRAQRFVDLADQLPHFSSTTRLANKPCNRASDCSGCLKSWLAAARNRDLAALAISACFLAAVSASEMPRRSVTSSKVMTTPSVFWSWVR